MLVNCGDVDSCNFDGILPKWIITTSKACFDLLSVNYSGPDHALIISVTGKRETYIIII